MGFSQISYESSGLKFVPVNFTANIICHPRTPDDLEIGTTKFSETWSQWVEPDDAQD